MPFAGKHAGVAVLLKEVMPFCIVHRLNLAASSAGVELPMSQQVDKLVNDIAAVFAKSAKKLWELRELQEELVDPLLRPTQIMTVRCLSRRDCIVKLVRCLPALLGFLSTEDRRLYDQLRSYQILHALHILADLTNRLAVLSKTFQADSVDLCAIEGLVEGTKVDLTEAFLCDTGVAGMYGGVLREFEIDMRRQKELEPWQLRVRMLKNEEQRRADEAALRQQQLTRLHAGVGNYVAQFRVGGWEVTLLQAQGLVGVVQEHSARLFEEEMAALRARSAELRSAMEREAEGLPLFTFKEHPVLHSDGDEEVCLSFRKAFIGKLVENLEERFGAACPILTALGVLAPNHVGFPSKDNPSFSSFGCREIDVLIAFYGKSRRVDSKKIPEVISSDAAAVHREWKDFKRYVASTFHGLNLVDCWRRIAGLKPRSPTRELCLTS